MPTSPKQPRKNKAVLAQELAQQTARVAKVERTKTLARLIFPIVENLKDIYEAETVFNAVSGHIKYGLQMKENQIKVQDLEFDLEKGNESDIKHAVKTMIEALGDVPANEGAEITNLMGSKISPFLAGKHIHDPMSEITAKEFIAD